MAEYMVKIFMCVGERRIAGKMAYGRVGVLVSERHMCVTPSEPILMCGA